MNSAKVLTWVQVCYWLIIVGILVWAYVEDPIFKAAAYRQSAIWAQQLAARLGAYGLWAEAQYYKEIEA